MFNVTHASALLVTQSGLRARVLTDLDVLALLLSALCHDLEHPGLTNGFLSRAQHPLVRLLRVCLCVLSNGIRLKSPL